MENKRKKAIIIGAGPAGLTAAFELQKETDIIPVIFEQTNEIGGIAKTVDYKGNKIDIGGHRFFSKSARVMDWWINILPIESSENSPEEIDKIMLLRSRKSRIFFMRKFFDYPITLSFQTISNLGLFRMFKIGMSYIKASVFKRKENSLEDFFINRFGYELYSTFFKDYTQKVWGIPCSGIKPEWGAQRIKGLSITKTLLNALKKCFVTSSDLNQKNQETSLIERFIYPKFGPGFLWETVAKEVKNQNGEIYLNKKIIKINLKENNISSVIVEDTQTKEQEEHFADYIISTMPVKDLIESMDTQVPSKIQEVASNLKYRDFLTVGVLLDKLKIKENEGLISDNWIYIQENDVKMGRIQIFNNWSPYLLKDPTKVWIGLEYFCNENSHDKEEIWHLEDDELMDLALSELLKIDFIESKEDAIDSTVIRMPKAYPAYFGSYDDFYLIKGFTDKIENLFLIGRNGMHRYNNMDHSMLSAIEAVENIQNNITSKENIWNVNAEDDYHEQK